MTTVTYEGRKINSSGVISTQDSLTVEAALQININGAPFTVTMRTPGEDLALVRGLLHSESIINDPKFEPNVIIKDECDGAISILDVTIPEEYLGDGYNNSRSLLSVSSCGICGKTELDDLAFMGKVIESDQQVLSESISKMFDSMRKLQQTFDASGGSHAAAAFDLKGNMLTFKEDIGRHNAVDKVSGALLLQKRWKETAVLTVSGRISYEIIIKAFKARIPILAAVSAPSSLAVDFAKELGITLVAFCREDRMTCYAHPNRISDKTIKSQAG